MKTNIRAWRSEDAQSLAKAINNKNVQDNLRDGLPLPYTVSDAQEFITSMRAADPNTVFAWAITVDDVAVGSVGVFRKDNVHRLSAEMGYYIDEDYWGNGIATEAVKKVCDYIFENTDIVRIFAVPYAGNAGSCRVLEKAGFHYEGTLRKNAVKNGHIVDMKMYAVIRGEQ